MHLVYLPSLQFGGGGGGAGRGVDTVHYGLDKKWKWSIDKMKEPVYALDPGFFCRKKVARKQEWM